MYGNDPHSQSFNSPLPVIEPTDEEIELMRDSLSEVSSMIANCLTSEFNVSSMLLDEPEGTKMQIIISGPIGHTSFTLDVHQNMIEDGKRPFESDEAKEVGADIAATMVKSMYMNQSDNADLPAS